MTFPFKIFMILKPGVTYECIRKWKDIFSCMKKEECSVLHFANIMGAHQWPDDVDITQICLQSHRTWARAHPHQVWLLSRDSTLCCSGSHYSQSSRQSTQSPCDVDHMAWFKKCSIAQRLGCVTETGTPGCNQIFHRMILILEACEHS